LLGAYPFIKTPKLYAVQSVLSHRTQWSSFCHEFPFTEPACLHDILVNGVVHFRVPKLYVFIDP